MRFLNFFGYGYRFGRERWQHNMAPQGTVLQVAAFQKVFPLSREKQVGRCSLILVKPMDAVLLMTL
jgi:hypothetical protein